MMKIFSAKCNLNYDDEIVVDEDNGYIYITAFKGDGQCDVELNKQTSIELANAILNHYGEK